MLDPPNNHCFTARAVLALARRMRNKPALTMRSPNAARMNVRASSSSDVRSINQNDGKARKTVTTPEAMKEKILSPKRNLAEVMAHFSPVRFRAHQANATRHDSEQYTTAKNARETARPRATNITSAPLS
jgi:hypothetical protein